MTNFIPSAGQAQHLADISVYEARQHHYGMMLVFVYDHAEFLLIRLVDRNGRIVDVHNRVYTSEDHEIRARLSGHTTPQAEAEITALNELFYQ